MVLFDQLRGIVQEGDARVKARATVEHHRLVLCTGGQIHSFLSLQIESGFGAILQTAGELLPLLGHIFSVPSRSARRLEVIGWSCHCGCQNGHALSCCRKCRTEHCQRVYGV